MNKRLNGHPVDVAAKPKREAAYPRALSIGEVIQANPEQRPVVVDQVAREGDVVIAVSGSKGGKSWTMADLMIRKAVGRPWLDTLAMRPGRSLLIDAELAPDDVAFRFRTVAGSMGVAFDQYADMIDVLTLRGRLKDLAWVERWLREQCEPGALDLIVIDALYRFLPAGPGGENDNAVMTGVFNDLQRIAERQRAAVFVVHHSPKGHMGDRNVADVGAGAGSPARACDTQFIVRPHEEPGCAVLDGVNRSFPPFVPLGLRWRFPRWEPDPMLDVTRLKRERGRGGAPRKGEGPAKPAKPEPYTAETFAAQFVTAEPATQELIIAVATDGRRMPEREARRLLLLAEQRGLIHRHAYDRDRRAYFANREQTVAEASRAAVAAAFPKARGPGMTAKQARAAVTGLAKLFPGQVTDAQAKAAAAELKGRDPAAVAAAIRAHHRDRQRIDWPALYAACEGSKG